MHALESVFGFRDFRVALLLTVCLVFPGCGDATEAELEWGGTVDTLASGLVAVTNPSDPLWSPGDEWELIEEVRVGGLAGDNADVFGEIVGLELDPHGRLLVLDVQAAELRVFAASGQHLRTVGRPGEGPGELRRPLRVDIDSDGRSWIVDPENARVSVFDTTGSFVESHRITGGFFMLPWPGGLDDDDHYYVPAPAQDFEMELVRYGPDWLRGASTPVPRDPFERPRFEQRADDGRVTAVANMPFDGRLHWRLSRQGTIWTLITDRYRLTELGMASDTLRTITREFDPLPITAEDRDRAREELDWFLDRGGQVDWSLLPESKPVAEGFFLDDQGYIWVQRARESQGTDAAGSTLDVFDPEGRFLGTVKTPFHLDVEPAPVVRGEVLLGVTRDQFDVQYVIRASIVGR